MRCFISCLFLFLYPTVLCAQQPHIIRGTVTDEKGTPLPFANFFLTTSKTGAISNNEGAFLLNFSGNAETLKISFISYETQMIEVEGTQLLEIRMKPHSFQLGEVTVTALSAEGLLKKAIDKIPDNYPQEPFLSKVYVRHKLSEKDTLRYMQEFALNAVKSYRSSFSDQFFLVRNRNFRFDPDHRGSLRGVGDLDILKNPPNARFFREADIRYLPSTTFDNRPVYVLEYSRKNRENSHGSKIYIDKEDLAIVRFELNRESGDKATYQYEKIDDKYYLMNVTIAYNNIRTDRIILVETSMITTSIVHEFSRNNIEGTRVDVSDILEVYATQEADTVFWQQHSAILPDSTILEALERYAERQRDSAIVEPIVRNEQQYQAFIKKLYTPNISLMVSSDLSNDFSTFNHNFNSINRYVLHTLDRKFRNPMTKMLTLMTYNYLISFPFGNAASEWLLLNKNGIRANMNPTILNRYLTSYLYNVNNTVLSNLKNNNYLDFMRLHTIRNDGRYVRSFLIEEDLAKIDLSNRNNRYSFVMLYWTELAQHRIMNAIDPFGKKDTKPSDKPENKQPLIVDRGRSWVTYLFNPEMDYLRHIREDDLTDEEQRYFTRSAFWSLLNLASPQMFFIRKFPLGENHSFTFNLNYLPVPFGEMFGQSIWLMTNHSQLHGIFFKQYRNYEKTSLGVGYKLYDVKLFQNAYMTSTVNYWQQPNDLRFFEHSFFSGFHVGQTFEYRLLRNQFSEQNKLSLLLGYDYKTKGYMPESFFMNENFDVKIGFRWNF